MAAERARAAVREDARQNLDAAIQVASELGPWLPVPAQGDTLTLWEALASLGAVDPTVAHVTEPPLDPPAILREAGRLGQVHETEWARHSPGWKGARLWQVYAAE